MIDLEESEEVQAKSNDNYSLLEKYWFCLGVDTTNNLGKINGLSDELNLKNKQIQLNKDGFNSNWQRNNEAEYEDEYLQKYSERSFSEGEINNLINFRHWKSEISNLLQQKEASKNLSSK